MGREDQRAGRDLASCRMIATMPRRSQSRLKQAASRSISSYSRRIDFEALAVDSWLLRSADTPSPHTSGRCRHEFCRHIGLSLCAMSITEETPEEGLCFWRRS